MEAFIAPSEARIVTSIMTEDEAMTLAIICGGTRGDPINSRRGHIDQLIRVLESVDILQSYNSIDAYSDGIMFKDFKTE